MTDFDSLLALCEAATQPGNVNARAALVRLAIESGVEDAARYPAPDLCRLLVRGYSGRAFAPVDRPPALPRILGEDESKGFFVIPALRVVPLAEAAAARGMPSDELARRAALTCRNALTKTGRDLTQFARSTLDPRAPSSGRRRTLDVPLVLTVGGEVAGVAALTLVRGSVSSPQATAELSLLCVDPEVRGRGIGGRFLAQVEQRAQATAQQQFGQPLQLITLQATPRARAFYEANGYSATQFPEMRKRF